VAGNPKLPGSLGLDKAGASRKQAGMIAQLSLDMNLPRWELWCIPLAGLVCTGFVLVSGRLLFRRHGKAAAGPNDGQAAVYETQETPKRRQTPRGRGTPCRILVTDEAAKTDPYSAYVINRSMGGLCVSLLEPVEVGTTLKVRPTKDLLNDQWFPVLVKYCRQADAGWEMGCEFVGRTSTNMLLMFS
jgi:hypothetical protein